MSKRFVVVAMVSCSATPARKPVEQPTASDVPATVAKLFVQGTKWSFATTRRITNVGHEPTTVTGTLTCEITASSARPHGRNSHLSCTAAPTELGYFPDDFAATPAGLWQLFEDTPLDPASAMIDEPPKVKSASEQFSEGSASVSVTSGTPGRWCAHYESGGMGQFSGWMFCVRDGDFVGGVVTSESGDESSRLEWGEHD